MKRLQRLQVSTFMNNVSLKGDADSLKDVMIFLYSKGFKNLTLSEGCLVIRNATCTSSFLIKQGFFKSVSIIDLQKV